MKKKDEPKLLELSFQLGFSFHPKERIIISIEVENVLDFVGIIKRLGLSYPKIQGL